MKRARTQGALRQKLSSVLAAQLPHMSAADISRHENWYRALKSIAERKKLATQAHDSVKQQLFEEGKKNVASARKKAAEDAALAEELEKQEKARFVILWDYRCICIWCN